MVWKAFAMGRKGSEGRKEGKLLRQVTCLAMAGGAIMIEGSQGRERMEVAEKIRVVRPVRSVSTETSEAVIMWKPKWDRNALK